MKVSTILALPALALAAATPQIEERQVPGLDTLICLSGILGSAGCFVGGILRLGLTLADLDVEKCADNILPSVKSCLPAVPA